MREFKYKVLISQAYICHMMTYCTLAPFISCSKYSDSILFPFQWDAVATSIHILNQRYQTEANDMYVFQVYFNKFNLFRLCQV